MSYDIFCYKSKSGMPDEEEANLVIETDGDKWAVKEKDESRKIALVKALKKINPRLQAFDFDYGEIANLTATTIEEAKNKFSHIELNSSEGDLAVQLIIYDNHVYINVPYWYQGEKATLLFEELSSYINVIRETAGYLVYDPQEGRAYDPVQNSLDGLAKYLSISNHLDEIAGLQNRQHRKAVKPWWKFW